MKNLQLEIIPTLLLEEFASDFPPQLQVKFNELHDAELSTSSFSFYTSVASVYSSKIEGENIELDSYVKHKKFRVEFQPDYTRKIDDLYDAYSFAKNNSLTEANVSGAHKFICRHLLAENQQGKYRNQNMYVTTPEGKIEYVAASPYAVKGEMEKFFHDVEILLSSELTVTQVFYFASMIHLVFLKIHPWNDGNGRTARLLEKWFLAQMLGEKAWFIQSEKYYYENHQAYYNNIRAVGLEYEHLNFSNALGFLKMLPESVSRL